MKELFHKSAALLLMLGSCASARIWTDRHGRAFEGEYYKMDGDRVVLILANGRTFSIAIADLGAADRADLDRQLRTSTPLRPTATAPVPAPAAAAPRYSNFGRPWPRDIRMDGASSCKAILEDAKNRRFIYESPGYRFTADARITDDALRNFAMMFETTRKFALNLPLSLAGKEKNGKMDILLYGEMGDYIRAGGPPSSAGCFVPSLGVVMVPMESIGLKKGGTGYSLDSRKKNLVLIHELAHQLTPDVYFTPGSRGWFSEGLAEYLAATPYSWGYFAPDVHGNAVKAYVTGNGSDGTGGRGLGAQLQAPRLRHLFLMDYSEFSGRNGVANYALGLLVTHYFFHMEGGGRGARIRAFLEGLQKGASGEESLKPLLGGGTYEKLEAEIAAEWAKRGVMIRFGS